MVTSCDRVILKPLSGGTFRRTPDVEAMPYICDLECTHDTRGSYGDLGADARVFGRIVMAEAEAEMARKIVEGFRGEFRPHRARNAQGAKVFHALCFDAIGAHTAA